MKVSDCSHCFGGKNHEGEKFSETVFGKKCSSECSEVESEKLIPLSTIGAEKKALFKKFFFCEKNEMKKKKQNTKRRQKGIVVSLETLKTLGNQIPFFSDLSIQRWRQWTASGN